MQEAIYNSQLNLSEFYPSHLFKNLSRVFPRLNSIIKKNNTTDQILVDKFLFYKMILEKIKNYFELSERFVISESIDIILKDIKNRKKINTNKKELPLIKHYENIKIKFNYPRDSKSPGNYSINDSRNKKIITNVSSQNNISFNNNFSNNNEKISNNTTSVKNVYLNLEKNRNNKIKSVHFLDDSKNKKRLEKAFTKKNNFKNNNNGKKQLNHTGDFKNNNNLKVNFEQKKPLVKNTTEYSLRNIITDIKKPEIKQIYENVELKLPNRINNIYEKNLKNFVNIDDKNFNIFEFEKKVGQENTLLLVGKYIFNYYKFNDIINQTKFDNWSQKIAKGYNRTNFYHHDLHAADITQTSYIYLKNGLIQEIAKLDNYMICAIIMGCICHDYKHPGVNNNFLIDTDNIIALNYNDISVLESMHVSEAFKLMHSNSNYNVFEGMDRENYKKIRKYIIMCVLATDMTKHNLSINFLKNLLNENNKPEDNNKQDYMDLVIHTADISNPTKIFDIYFNWAKLVVEEFYSQGDKEKKLGLKCSCDRTKVTIYKNQLGFIDYIELPFFSLVVKAFPKLDSLLDNLNNNKKTILKLEEESKNKEKTADKNE